MSRPAALSPFKDVPCRFRFSARGGRGTMDIFGVIGSDWFGDGVTSKVVSDALKKMGSVSTIAVNINSPGGDVFEGRAIYNLLKGHRATIEVSVVAEAASAASLIAMAGDDITMAEGSLMMIHRAAGLAFGNAEEVQKLVGLLETIDETMVKTYAARSGNAESEVRTWMDAETWMTADEAVARGFATRAAEPAKVAALALNRTLLGYRNLPAALRPNRARARELIAGITG